MKNNLKNSLRKLLCGCIAAALCSAFSVSGAAIYAENAAAARTAAESSVTVTGTIDLLGESEPLFPYSLKPDNVFEGDSYYTQLDDISKDYYELFYSKYKNGGNKNEVDLLPILKKYNKIEFDDETAMTLEILSHVYTAFMALAADHPELSWISHTEYTLLMSNSCIDGIKILSADFSLTKGYKYGTPSEINAAVDNAKNEIVSDGSRYEVVKSIHDYICETVDYNHKAASENPPAYYDTGWYQTAYSAFYPISSNRETEVKTVCAGYATAFKVLCDVYGIPCVTVRGSVDSGELHMWNYVKMDDGKWYAVDATWDDQTENTGEIYYNNFLVGASTLTNSGLTFSERHINMGYWDSYKRYLFAYPELSDKEYESDDIPTPAPDPAPDPDPDPGKEQLKLTDETGNTGIVVIAEKDMLDENTTLNVEEKEIDPEKPNRIVYDITLVLNGEMVQPKGSVTVKIPVPEALADKRCGVYYRDMSDGTEKLIDMSAVTEEGYLVFNAEHFSEYVVSYDDNPSIILGDVDGSGTINDRDSIQLDRYLAEWGNEINIAAADFNADGNVNDRDSIILARTLAGWYE